MKYLNQVTVLVIAYCFCSINCKPHHGFKSFQIELQPFPFKYVSLVLKKLAPFGEYEIKHEIEKRQAAEAIVPLNEAPLATDGTIEDIVKIEKNEVEQKAENILLEPNLTPQVIITSVVKPIEDSEPLSLTLPIEPKKIFVKEKDYEEGQHLNAPLKSEVYINEISTPERIVEITPKPHNVLAKEKLPLQNVIINTPIESTVPSIAKIPLVKNLKEPIIRSFSSNIANRPYLYTDISRIPLNYYPLTPPGVGVPEYNAPILSALPLPSPANQLPEPVYNLPLPPLPPKEAAPPLVKEEPPIVKEESPNFLVKGSRFVLYFGSMMLQMLSQLVNGRINLDQPIEVPLLTPVQ